MDDTDKAILAAVKEANGFTGISQEVTVDFEEPKRNRYPLSLFPLGNSKSSAPVLLQE